jgi:hypothetical protein
MTARRHHFVSQCYLNGFVANRDKPRLFVVDLQTRRTFETSPANVAAERDFHRIDIDGHSPDALENAFSEFEARLDQALRRIVAARSIADPNDRALVFGLIAILAVKNPRLRQTYGDFSAQVAKLIMELSVSTPQRFAAQIRAAKRRGVLAAGTDIDYEQMREFVKKREYEIAIRTMEHLRVELPTIDHVIPTIAARKWMLFRAPPGLTFVTADHPVCLMWANPAERGQLPPPGFALEKTQVLFPLSQHLAMVGAFEMQDEERDANELMVAKINGAIVLYSTRQVYARDQHFCYKFNHNVEIRRGDQLLDDPGLFRRTAAERN